MELNRFKQLLESTMGNVKPLISEATEANAGAIQQFLQHVLLKKYYSIQFNQKKYFSIP